MAIAIVFIILAIIVLLLPAKGVALASVTLLGIFFSILAFSLLLISFFYEAKLRKTIAKLAANRPFALSHLAKGSLLPWYFTLSRCAAALAFFAAVEILWLGFVKVDVALAWLFIFLGISFSGMELGRKAAERYIDPDWLLSKIASQAKRYGFAAQAKEFCSYINALVETAVSSLKNSQTAIASKSLQKAVDGTSSYFSKNSAFDDTGPYVIHHLLLQLDYCQAIAQKEQYEAFSTEILNGVGKLTLASAVKNPLLAISPIQFIGKWVQRGQNSSYSDMALLGSCLLIQLAKELTQGCKQEREKLYEPLLIIVSQLAEIARVSFRRNKAISIPAITQPLRDLQKFLEEDKSDLPDKALVEAALKNALEEFDALQSIMLTIPPEEKESPA